MNCLTSSDNSLRLLSDSPEDTFELGMAMGEAAFPGLLILLRGPLGAGKTRLTQGYGAALGFKRVKSPSFIIMNEYDGALPLLHADLYRLEKSSEADALGIGEYLEDGFTAVVEWAERWKDPEAENMITIDIARDGGCEEKRAFAIHAAGEGALSLLKTVGQKMGAAPLKEEKELS